MFFVFSGCNSDRNNTDSRQAVKDKVTFYSYTDSLEYIVKTGHYEAQLEALSDLYYYYQNSDIQKALQYAWHQKHLAKQHQNIEWLADAYDNLGDIYFYEQVADSTDYYYKSAFDLWSALGDRVRIGISLVNMSNIMRLYMRPDSTLALLLKALVIFETEEDDNYISQTLANIAATYNDIGNFKKHDEYAFKALSIQERSGSSSALGITFINLCLSMKSQGHFSEAVEYGECAINVFREIDNPYLLTTALVKSAEALLEKGEKERAIQYINEAILYADQIGSIWLKIETLRARANFYMQSGNYAKAKLDAEEALTIMDTINVSKMEQVYIFDLLTTLSICTNEKEDAQRYLKQYKEIKNILQQEKWTEQISEMETKYETEKKQLKINAFEKEKKLFLGLILTGGIVLFLALAVFIFLWQWTVQKKSLAVQQKLFTEQQLKQLEKEKQLIAAQAALDGENAERIRLAKDLHDGLGSMLSLVKITLPNMESGVVIEAEDVERFNKALTMLDNSINEMRRLAHHMMPESLVRNGFKTSLSDFCLSIDTVEFHYFGNDQRMNSKLEIMMYRAAHELINNALKHAKASQIKVQLVQEDERVSLIVCDNGKGFDTKKKFKGMGLENIRNRVEAYNGTMTLYSSIGNGTEVNIEIEIIN